MSVRGHGHSGQGRLRIYLDSRDLIVLVEKKSSEETAKFEERLRRNRSELVFSLHNITECCAPLVNGGEGSGVMRMLNRLEQMPHLYIADARIEALELEEAVSAFLEHREYAPIAPPFVPRFDYVVSAFDEPPTREYLEYGLAHTIYELWNIDKSLLTGYPSDAKKLRAILEADRKRVDYKKHESNFPNTIARNLRLYSIPFPLEKVGELARWIYDTPSRCPAQRLGYEVFHKLLRNLTDNGEDSDIPDFAHISCVPYVDAVTLDNRMRGYVDQVDRSIGTNFSQKVHRNLEAIERLL